MSSEDRKSQIHTKHSDVSETVVLIIDVINPFEFNGWEQLVGRAALIASPILELKQRAREAEVPIIYVNDNFGQWRSNSERLVEYCRTQGHARELVEQVAPHDDDYFVLKPMHSGFYQTPLDALLRYFGATAITLCGIATNSCIVCTAHDAKMRDFTVTVAGDCCASYSARLHAQALEHMKAMAGARILRASSLRF